MRRQHAQMPAGRPVDRRRAHSSRRHPPPSAARIAPPRRARTATVCRLRAQARARSRSRSCFRASDRRCAPGSRAAFRHQLRRMRGDRRHAPIRPMPPSPVPRRRATPPSRPSPPRRSSRAIPRPPARARKSPCATRCAARRQQRAEHRRLDQRQKDRIVALVQLRRTADRAHHAVRPRDRSSAAAPAPIFGRRERHGVIGAREFAHGLRRVARHARRNVHRHHLRQRKSAVDLADRLQHAARRRTGDAGAEQRIHHQRRASRIAAGSRASPGSRTPRSMRSSRRHRPSAPPGPRSSTTSSAAGRKRVNSCRAITRPSPPLLPLPQSTTIRCAPSGAKRLRQKLHHAVPGILHQHDAGNAHLDRAAIDLAHLGRGQHFHRRRATTMVISSCNSPDAGPLLHRLHHARDDLAEESAAVLHQQILQPLFAELLAVRILRLHDAVGVGHQHVAAVAAAISFSS